MSMNFNAAPEDEPGIIGRSTGAYREAPGVCFTCGADLEPGPRFGAEATCDHCRRTVGQPDPWVLLYGTPAPFTFTRNGATYTCAWHEGFDPWHPANRGASHGLCDVCSERMGES